MGATSDAISVVETNVRGYRTVTSMKRAPEVDAYIRGSPPEIRRSLRAFRQAIRTAEPNAVELISYKMPGYSLPGYDHKGMFAWFGLQSDYVGLYVRPPTIATHREELKGYETTKSAIHFPLAQEVPVALVQKLVRASLREMKQRGR